MKLEQLSNQDKKQLRKHFKSLRNNISNKTELDKKIFDLIIKCDDYINAKQILCYVSMEQEVNTLKLIDYSISIGKNVAVPYCVDDNGSMDFYYINSIKNLRKGTFDVLEPNIEKSTKATDFSDAIIIVPGLSFDINGYRLGYGKGYYDRFLEKYSLKSVGLCYNSFIVEKLPYDNFDKKVDIIISDIEMKYLNGGQNG